MTPKCPNCNVELSFNSLDNDYYEGSNFYAQCSGECPECEKKFSWFEVYKFDRFTNVEEEEENV